MTDRINALTVFLDKDVREDDVQPLCEAILHLRRVIAVKKNVTNVGASAIAEERVRRELMKNFHDLLQGKPIPGRQEG